MKTSNLISAGLIIGATLFAVLMVYQTLSGKKLFQKTTKIFVEYEFVGGLAKSEPVFANGIKVGLVEDMYLKEDYSGKIIVVLDIREKVNIPKRTVVARITDSDLLGNKMVRLEYPQGRYEAADCLQDGDTIQGDLGSIFADMTADFDPIVERAKKTYQVADSLFKMWQQRTFQDGNSVQNAREQVSEMMANFDQTSNDLQQLIRRTNRQVTQISNNAAVVQKNFKTGDGGDFEKIQKNTAAFSENMKKVNLQATSDKVAQTVQQWEVTLQAIQQAQAHFADLSKKMETGSLQKIRTDPRFVGSDSTATKRQLNFAELLEDIRKHPENYTHFKMF